MKDVAYLNGVLVGDGWCSSQRIGLRTKDLDFAQAFCGALKRVFHINLDPKRDERGYWLVRTSNKAKRFDCLVHYMDYIPEGDTERAMWLRGLFDSEGNANLTPQPQLGPDAYSRRVAIYSTSSLILERAASYLSMFGITTRFRATKSGLGHKGNKIVYELRLRCSYSNYKLFLQIVGSSIRRKHEVLEAIPQSYKPDLSAHLREAQLKAAKARHKKTMSETLPKVVSGVQELMKRGIKPTQRNCRSIPGFNSIQRYIRQADLIAMAVSELP